MNYNYDLYMICLTAVVTCQGISSYMYLAVERMSVSAECTLGLSSVLDVTCLWMLPLSILAVNLVDVCCTGRCVEYPK